MTEAQGSDALGRVIELFHAVVDLPEAERRRRLAQLCSDPALEAEVLELVAMDRAAQGTRESLLAPFRPFLPPFPERSPEGQTFGDYKILRKIGAGGMGTVFLAERTSVGGLVAIKILSDDRQRDRFLREQRMHARLVHPGIPQFHGAGTTEEDRPFFVLEYVDGTPLTEFAWARNVSLDERIRLFRSACEAVAYVHQCGLIHRDLKPSNILVSHEGTVKVLDFGIAKAIDGHATMTATDGRAFTPSYAAPEQLCGDPVSTATDVYALGVVLYELLSGGRPFDAAQPSLPDLIARAYQRTASRPSFAARQSERGLRGLRASTWADLDRMTAKCLEAYPEARYPSVEALLRDVIHFQCGEPLEAREPSVFYRGRKFVRRHRLAAAGISLASLALTITTATYVANVIAARNRAEEQVERADRAQRILTELLAGVDGYVGPARDLTVGEVLDRAEVQVHKLMIDDPALSADLESHVASLRWAREEVDRAEPLNLHALAAHERMHGLSSIPVVKDLILAAQLAMFRGEFDDAEKTIREAQARLESAETDDAECRAASAAVLGAILNESGRYQEAQRNLEHAQKTLLEEHAAPDLVAAVRDMLANTYYYLGRLEEAQALNLELNRYYEMKLGADHPYVGHGIINLGMIAVERSRYEEAERWLARGYEIMKQHYGENTSEAASALALWARTLSPLGRTQEARTHLERALQIHETLVGRVHPRVASVLSDLAHVAVAERRYDDAERYAREALEIEEVTASEDAPRVGTALSNLAKVLIERGDPVTAEVMLRRGIEIYAVEFPEDHVRFGAIRLRLAQSLRGQGRLSEAETEARSALSILIHREGDDGSSVQKVRAELELIAQARAGDGSSR